MFSVVIPLYNKEKYIRRAVDSVLNQDLEDFELIIVNDGSTDQSLAELDDITDSRLKVVNQDNAGVGAARNTGIREAKFGWVALLDADDFWAVDHLYELSKIIKKYPLSGLISTKTDFVQEEFINLIRNDISESNINSIDYFYESSKDLSIVTSSSACIKKIVFEKLGGFADYKMGEDLEYWARIALEYPVSISNKITSYYVRGTGGVTEQEVQKKCRKIESLNEVSPSIKFIVEKAKVDPTILKNPSIVSYINSRLFNGAKVWIYRENISAAKSLSKLALPQKDSKYFVLYFVTKAPKSVLKTAIKTYKLLK